MKRWISLAASLYPRNWREEYGAEFDALLDDVKPGWRVVANVLGGAIRMQITTGTNWLKLVAATAAFGAIVALGASFTVEPRYVSSATLSIAPQADPLRPTSPQALRQRTAGRVIEIENEILSRTSLSATVQKLDLYTTERRRTPLEDVLEQMRRNIRIEFHPSTDGGLTPIVLGISFAYPDQAKAQAAVRALAAKFAESNAVSNRTRDNVYRTFWQDHAPTVPPPVGDTITVLDPPSLPKPVGPNRIAFLSWGLGAGLLLGLLAALAMRWPRGVWQLGGFAAAGCILAGAASFLIPDRYTSTAVMEIEPAALTEDQLATPPAVTPAAEFLRQVEPQILSFQSLSRIIQYPGLNLYPGERTTHSMEDVVRNMLARDLRIAVLSGGVSAFSISFSYSDRYKAHAMVQRLITALNDQHIRNARVNAVQMSDRRREILQRKAGENLDVLDPPSLPVSPESPNRMRIAAAGLGIGLLLGAIALFNGHAATSRVGV